MDELLEEIKSLVIRNFPHIENLSRQKLALLSQREPKFILIEGLKLLSMLIEIDSCKEHNCNHNFEDLTVEQIILQSGKLCPSLPLVTPDGYKFVGENLILLECFVRVSPASFEQKYKEDTLKLMALKKDLMKIGINLIPLVDGRTNYNNNIVPDWVVQRLKFLIIKITEFEQENSEVIEQAEYDRLIESLKSRPENSLGIENLNSLTDKRTNYYDELITSLIGDIDNHMTSIDISVGLSQIYNEFRDKLKNNQIIRHLRQTNKEDLLNEFDHLYDAELRTKHYFHKLTLGEIVKLGINSNQLSKISLSYKMNDKLESTECRLKDPYVTKVLSMLNKVKSLKILNTHRNALLNFDILLLNAHIHLNKRHSKYLESREWKCNSCGGSMISVNDRLVFIEATVGEYLTKLDRIAFKNKKLDDKELVHQELMKKFKLKIRAKLKEVNISETIFSLDLDSMIIYSLSDMKKFVDLIPKISPQIHYIKDTKIIEEDQTESEYEEDIMMLDFGKLFSNVSSLCLSLCNSMKTSSICKLRQNSFGTNRYGVVSCKECFTQPLKLNDLDCYLIYQKTGESSRCYSLCDNDGHFASFYADPKRFFLPVFSNNVLIEMVEVMMTWIMPIPKLSSKLKEIKVALLTLILLVICNPSKRVQKLLQNYRYYIMAYVNSFHLCSLMDKIKEDLITDTEYHIYRLLNWLNKIILSTEVVSLLTNRFKFLLNVSYCCHLITKETPDRSTDMIKCFEKFLYPKFENDLIALNGHDIISESEQTFIKDGISKLFKKDILENNNFGIPGVNKKIFSLMVSSFNLGLLQTQAEKENLKNPMKVASCATAMDLASNKSVVKPKIDDFGKRVLDYEYNKVVATSIFELAEVFKKKESFK